MGNENRPIVIEGAMKSELDLLLGAMDKVRERSLFGYPVFEGSIDGHPVIAVRNKIGMVNAAIATKAAIDEYKPCCVLSEGTAGGYDANVHTGDIILGERVYNINSVHMRLEDCLKLKAITSGEWRREQCFESDRKLLSLAENIRIAPGRIIKGAMGSADFWSFKTEEIREVQARYGTLCEDMESFAVAQTCAQMNVPCLCIRVISNNEPAGEAVNENAAAYAQQFTLELVRNIVL